MTFQRRIAVSALARSGAMSICMFVALAQPALAYSSGEHLVSDVRQSIADGDCTGAVKSLNKGLAAHYPDVQMLAGSLYETGTCLKANWNRAANLYMLAYKGGQPAAAFHLAAGYALPENGPSVAPALWWASRVNLIRGDCIPSGAARDDDAAFLAEVKTWSDARLSACNYVTGVMSTITGEVRYPQEAQSWAAGGKVVVTFKPGVPRVELTLNGTENYLITGLQNGDRMRERDDNHIDNAFVKTVRAAADHALARYPKPDGIPVDAPGVELIMDFTMETSAMPTFLSH